MNTLRMRYNLW